METVGSINTLRVSSLAAFGLLSALCALTLVSGVSQQWFEWVHDSESYADALRRDGGWLRTIVALDDLFIAAYVTATVALASAMARDRWQVWHVLIAVMGVGAGVLDLEENHHLLALARNADRSIPIAIEQILTRSALSQLKWMLGHLAFVLVGVAIRGKGPLVRALRGSLIVWQLPVGALTWAVETEPWYSVLVWLRYGSFLAGFASLAALTRRGAALGPVLAPAPVLSDAAAAGSDAPS